jgi:hypothetical protein
MSHQLCSGDYLAGHNPACLVAWRTLSESIQPLEIFSGMLS